MALMRYDPFRELDRLTQQVLGTPTRAAVMAMDAYRRGDQFLVHFDLPGVEPASIEVSVEKNVLTVKAERTASSAEGDEVLVAERPQGSFSRQLFLGETLDTDHIKATYDHGVLTLAIPVAEAAKPRKVPVSVGEKASAVTTTVSA
jgi:HSP20 family protein